MDYTLIFAATCDAPAVSAFAQASRPKISPSPSLDSDTSPLPWLVLYCGANPKVEEVRIIDIREGVYVCTCGPHVSVC